MFSFLIHDNMINLQVDSNNQSKWFMVKDENDFEFLTPANDELSKISDGGIWRITLQKTKRHKPTMLSVSTYSILALYDYLTLNVIRNNYQVIVFNSKYKILVTETN